MTDAVSDDEKLNGFERCREYLGGAWSLATVEQFHMEYIRGGLSNMLYCCWLSDDVPSVGTEPRRVLVRIYGQIIHEHPQTVLTDSVIFSLLAEKGMGPKLFGVFTTGRVEEYVPSRHLYTHELHHRDISVSCARIMAQFHQLTMPIVKQPRWLFDTMTRYLTEALSCTSSAGSKSDLHQSQLERILSFDLATELQWLRHVSTAIDSPVVFCHNDLQEGNILYVENKSGWHVRPIDFEYSSYNYRGFDIGNHFCEWCYCYDCNEYPYFTAKLDDYPSHQQQLRFVRAYLSECQSAHRQRTVNGRQSVVITEWNGGGGGDGSIDDESGCTVADDDDTIAAVAETVMLEANVFALASHFLWAIWSVVQSRISTIQFGYLEYALVRLEAYFQQKSKLIDRLPNGCSTSSTLPTGLTS